MFLEKNKINNTKYAFEKEAERFDHIRSMYFESKGFEYYWQNRRREKVISSLKSLKSECLSVLDVGCAEGYFLKEAKKMGYVAKGIEISDLKRSRGVADGLDIVSGGAESLPFANNSYDIVMLNRVLEFVPDDMRALSEAKRVAKKIIMITVPRGSGRDDVFEYSWGLKRRSYNRSDLKNILQGYGNILELTSLCPLGFLPYGFGKLFKSLNLYNFGLIRVLDVAFENILFGGQDIFVLVRARED